MEGPCDVLNFSRQTGRKIFRRTGSRRVRWLTPRCAFIDARVKRRQVTALDDLRSCSEMGGDGCRVRTSEPPHAHMPFALTSGILRKAWSDRGQSAQYL